jgi:general secretion pathway protein D
MTTLVPAAILVALLVGSVARPGPARATPELAQAQTLPAPATVAPADPAGITLNFDDADIETVIQAVSDIVGFSYILAPDVRGKVTVRTPRAIPQDQVFSVFLSILETQGFTAIKTGDIYRIVRTDRARERPIPTFIGPEPGVRVPPAPRSGAAPPPRAPERLVTHVLLPRFAPAPGLARLVRPLVGARGDVLASPRANALVVTATASSMSRILGVLERLDVPAPADEVRVIRLQFADASHVAGILRAVFAGAGLARPPVIVADRHTNSLIIRARPSDLEAIARLLGSPD